MLEVRIDNNQLNALIKDLELSQRQILNIAKKVFKRSAKDFSKNVINKANNEHKIAKAKLKERIRQFVINDLKIKIFSGFYRIGITHWRARQLGKPRKGSKRRNTTRGGVEFGGPSKRQFIKSAFIVNSKRKDGSAGNRIAFKRVGKSRLPIAKQVAEIDDIITPILENEVDTFYKIFASNFDRECIKYLNRG